MLRLVWVRLAQYSLSLTHCSGFAVSISVSCLSFEF